MSQSLDMNDAGLWQNIHAFLIKLLVGGRPVMLNLAVEIVESRDREMVSLAGSDGALFVNCSFPGVQIKQGIPLILEFTQNKVSP